MLGIRREGVEEFKGLYDAVAQTGLGVGVLIAMVGTPCFHGLDHPLGCLARMAAYLVQGRADVAGHLWVNPSLRDREVADDQHGDGVDYRIGRGCLWRPACKLWACGRRLRGWLEQSLE